MNFFYEELPCTVHVHGKKIPIITDFREYIRLLDMLKCEELNSMQRLTLLAQYFLYEIEVDEEAISALTEFVVMDFDSWQKGNEEDGIEPDRHGSNKNLYSYEMDYPFILSGFMRDYRIDLESVEYLHWWKFRMLFDGLSEDTEIKQRIMYRSIDLSDIKDKDERKRISRIQRRIQLPQESITDYDIGNAFA